MVTTTAEHVSPLHPPKNQRTHAASESNLPLARRLKTLPTAQLRTLIKEHQPTSGGGRCRRCGQPYGPSSRACEVSRAIRHEISTRQRGRHTTIPNRISACRAQPHHWQLDNGDESKWRRAIELCGTCPLLTQCHTELEGLLAEQKPPVEMIFAGRAFDNDGNEVEPQRFHEFAMAQTRGNKRRRSVLAKEREPATANTLLIAYSRLGKQWSISVIDGEICARRRGRTGPAALISDIVAVEGPLRLEYRHPTRSGAAAAPPAIEPDTSSALGSHSGSDNSGTQQTNANFIGDIYAYDHLRRKWALVAVGGQIRARLVRGGQPPKVMSATDLATACGPIMLSPPRPIDDWLDESLAADPL